MFFFPNEVDKLYSSTAQTNSVLFESNSVADYNFVSSSSFAQGCCSSQVSVSSASTEDECSSTAAADRSSDENQQKPFLQALMDLLSQEDPEIVTWVPSGTAFIVRSPKKFVEMVLPRFFKQTKIASFYRQLNMYGFRRIVDGPDMGAYHHELFVRDKPHLCSSILRKRRTRKRTVPKSIWQGATIKSTPPALPVTVQPSTDESEVQAPMVALSIANGNNTSNLPPFPAADAIPSPVHKLNSSSGYSIVVCDHASKSMVEVAHYANIPCDLQSFALGVGGLLTDGIELYKAASYATVNGASTIASSMNNSSEFVENYNLLENYGERYDEYCEELDADISNMFRTESFASMYATAC
jgi:hypothetical protein